MKTFLAACALSLLAGTGWGAECVGKNLIAALPKADQAWIREQAEAVPYHQGIRWRASKGDARISIIGTYHFDHPMHAATVERLTKELTQADKLLVEMGPTEEKLLQSSIISDPTLVMDPTGQTLPERLDAAHWGQLSEAMEARGIPAVMASRMRPWYVATMLAFSPCDMEQMMAKGGATNGLDERLIDTAEAASVEIEALEPWDTVFRIFDNLSPQDEIDMIVYSLPMAKYADDYNTTMEDAYRAGDIWQIWEFGRLDAYKNSGMPKAEVDRMLADAEEYLINERNRSWIVPLTDAANVAAVKHKGVVAAFGALHLPGNQGVLRLLENDGWKIERIE